MHGLNRPLLSVPSSHRRPSSNRTGGFPAYGSPNAILSVSLWRLSFRSYQLVQSVGLGQSRVIHPRFLAMPFPQPASYFHPNVELCLPEHVRVVAEAEIPRPPLQRAVQTSNDFVLGLSLRPMIETGLHHFPQLLPTPGV